MSLLPTERVPFGAAGVRIPAGQEFIVSGQVSIPLWTGQDQVKAELKQRLERTGQFRISSISTEGFFKGTLNIAGTTRVDFVSADALFEAVISRIEYQFYQGKLTLPKLPAAAAAAPGSVLDRMQQQAAVQRAAVEANQAQGSFLANVGAGFGLSAPVVLVGVVVAIILLRR